MIGKNGFFLSLILMACSAVGAPCLENRFTGRTACVFPIVDLSDSPDQGDRQNTITEMVGLDLKGAGLELVAEEKWRARVDELSMTPRDLVSSPSAVSVAKSLGADMAVSGYFVMGDGFITVCVQCMETATGTLMAGFQKKDRFNLGFYNSLHLEIAGMLSDIGAGLDPSPSIASVVQKRLTEMVFTSTQDGMVVILGGDVIAGSIREGKLAFETPSIASGTPFVVEKRKEGFHTERQTVSAASEIPLAPLVKTNRFAVEADWTLGQLIGLGGAFRYYVLPDYFFLSNSHYLYFQAPYTPGATGILHYDIGLQVGGYIFLGPSSRFRIGVSSGFGTVFSFFFISSFPPATDLYINILNVSLEWNMPGISLFFRPEWKYTLGIGNNLLGISTMHWEVFPPMTLGVAFTW